MLWSKRLAQLAAVGTLTLLLGVTTAPDMALAQKGDHHAKSGDGDGKKSAKSHKAKSKHVKKSHRTKHVNKTTVRTKTVVHTRPAYRHHDRDRVAVRSTALYVPYVVIGRAVVYRSYGRGWCRALHKGRHWAPSAGWHSGRHVGRVRC